MGWSVAYCSHDFASESSIQRMIPKSQHGLRPHGLLPPRSARSMALIVRQSLIIQQPILDVIYRMSAERCFSTLSNEAET